MNSLANIHAVFKRESLSYFTSPVAYVIVVIFLLAAQGFAFLFGQFLESDNASLTNTFFFWHPWIYMVLAPAVGMRLWSEEHRLGTVELLLTMPVAPWHAIIGKYLAACWVWLIALALTFPIVWTLFYLGEPDPGPIWSGYVASYLYAISCLAITVAVSAFTRSQVVCFIIAVALCLAGTLLGFPAITETMAKLFPETMSWMVSLIAYCSLMTHFMEMSKGILVLRDVLYFASVIILALCVTATAIQIKRA